MILAPKYLVLVTHPLLWTLISDQALLWNTWKDLRSLNLVNWILYSPIYETPYCRHLLIVHPTQTCLRWSLVNNQFNNVIRSNILLTTKCFYSIFLSTLISPGFLSTLISPGCIASRKQKQNGGRHVPSQGDASIHQWDSWHEAVHHAGVVNKSDAA